MRATLDFGSRMPTGPRPPDLSHFHYLFSVKIRLPLSLRVTTSSGAFNAVLTKPRNSGIPRDAPFGAAISTTTDRYVVGHWYLRPFRATREAYVCCDGLRRRTRVYFASRAMFQSPWADCVGYD